MQARGRGRGGRLASSSQAGSTTLSAITKDVQDSRLGSQTTPCHLHPQIDVSHPYLLVPHPLHHQLHPTRVGS